MSFQRRCRSVRSGGGWNSEHIWKLITHWETGARSSEAAPERCSSFVYVMFCCQRFYSLYPCKSSSRFVLRISRRVLARPGDVACFSHSQLPCFQHKWVQDFIWLLLANRLTCFTFSPTLLCVSSVIGSTEALMSLNNLYLQLTYRPRQQALGD